MPGHRFYFPFELTDQKITLEDADEFQHLSRVLRLKAGDTVEVINGEGGLARGVIEGVGKKSAAIVLKDVSSTPLPVTPRITLACALPKKARFEFIIEKCTELGVDRIVPMVTARTEVVVGSERAEKKAERFSRVALNAAKQCKRLWFPEITAPVSFEQALESLAQPGARLFIPWLEGERVALGQALLPSAGCRELVFFIGPEGDFTPEEVRLAVGAGALPVDLCNNVLKVDTAAIAVVAAVRLKVWE